MTDENNDRRQAVALFRYGLIADLVQLPPGCKGLYRRFEEKAAAEYAIPGSTRIRVASETLRDWLKPAETPRRSRTLPSSARRGG